jgi:hypothetical protein
MAMECKASKLQHDLRKLCTCICCCASCTTKLRFLYHKCFAHPHCPFLATTRFILELAQTTPCPSCLDILSKICCSMRFTNRHSMWWKAVQEAMVLCNWRTLTFAVQSCCTQLSHRATYLNPSAVNLFNTCAETVGAVPD